MKKENNETKLLNNKEVIKLLNILEKEYANAKCGLDFENPLELTVSLILAAQCTDKRVNMIRPILFKKYPDVYELAKADRKELEEIIHSCGFYNNKAKNIIATANIIVDEFRWQSSKHYARTYFSCWYWKKKCKHNLAGMF